MKKTIWAILFLSVILTMSVLGAATVIRPAASGKMYNGAYQINVSTGLLKSYNCTVTISSSKTGDSQVYILKNKSAAVNYVNLSANTELLYDGPDYVITGTCMNKTQSATITSRTGLTVDNTKPICSFVSITDKASYDKDKTWTITGTNATSVNIFFGQVSYGTTEVSDVFSYAGTPITGTISLKATSTDGTNNTDCTSYNVNIDDASTKIVAGVIIAQNEEQSVQTQKAQSDKTKQIVMLVGAGFAVWYFFLRKK